MTRTPPDLERIPILLAEGLSRRAIARELHITWSTINRLHPRETTLAFNAIAPEIFDRALELLEEGVSYRDAAATLGISSSALGRHFPGRGWTNRECALHARLVTASNARIAAAWPAYRTAAAA